MAVGVEEKRDAGSHAAVRAPRHEDPVVLGGSDVSFFLHVDLLCAACFVEGVKRLAQGGEPCLLSTATIHMARLAIRVNCAADKKVRFEGRLCRCRNVAVARSLVHDTNLGRIRIKSVDSVKVANDVRYAYAGRMHENLELSPELTQDDLTVLSAVSEWHFSPAQTVNGGPRVLTEKDLLPVHPKLRPEMEAYLTAPPHAREVVRKRLPVLVRTRWDQTRGAMTRAAEELMTPRANVYRLLKRMVEMGPVHGLLPHERREPASSKARDGLDGAVERLMGELLAVEPDASIAKVERYVRDGLKRLNEAGTSVKLPSSSAIKRRLHYLRGTAVGAVVSDGSVGSRLLVEHCRLNIDVELDPRVAGMPRHASMMIAVDENTKLIVAFGMFLREATSGFASLVHDAEMRLPKLAEMGAPIATRLREIDWIVPPELDDRFELVGRDLPASRRPLIEPVTDGDRRGGSRLISLMGDQLGGLMLLTRPSKAAPLSRKHVRVMNYVTGVEAATYTVSLAVDRWNEGLLQAMKAKRRSNAAGRGPAERLAADLRTLFEPVLGPES